MHIYKTARFFFELENILDFIAKDSFDRAEQFKSNLDNKILAIELFPYKYRQSTKSKDDTVRDLIFHGYVVPYRVNQKNDKIEIIGIFSENEWEA